MGVIHLHVACLKGVDFLTPLSPEGTGVHSSMKSDTLPCVQNLKGTLGIVA